MLRIVRRQVLLVVLVGVLGLLVGGAVHVVRKPHYEASADLLLKQNDPAETVTDQTTNNVDPARYAAAQAIILTSPAVAQRAAAALADGTTAQQITDAVTVASGDNTDVLTISATSGDAGRAAATANAVGAAYIESNRLNDVAALQAAAAGIQTQLDTLSRRIVDLTSTAVARGGNVAADPSLTAANAQYSELYSRQQDLLIDASLKRGDAQLVSPATAPPGPSGLSMLKMAVLGLLLGLVVGLALAWLRESVGDRVRSREELQELSDLAVLGELPRDRQTQRREDHVAVITHPTGAFAESVRSLRSNITFLGIDSPITSVLVTSAMPGDGKTTVAANLAASFAQAGLRTVVVSADLRRPRVELLLGVDNSKHGLTGVLVEAARQGRGVPLAGQQALARQALSGALRQTTTENLSILPSGQCPPNPADLLASPQMDFVLEVLGEHFDRVVVDASPVLAVTDAAVLAPKVGNVLLVASSGSTRRRAVSRMVSAISATRVSVLGVVLNRADVDKGIATGYYGVEAYDAPSTPREAVPSPTAGGVAGRRVATDGRHAPPAATD